MGFQVFDIRVKGGQHSSEDPGTYFPRIWWPYDMRVSEHFQVRLCLFLDMETRVQKHNQDGA